MSLYKIGKVVSIGKSYIILESNYTGFVVSVARPPQWEVDKDRVRKVYFYTHRTEFNETYYGFSTFTERVLFEDLIGLSGIGPRTALSALRDGEETLASAISRGDSAYLATLPHLGAKSAAQIVFELKSKYEALHGKGKKALPGPATPGLREALKTLGFNARQIEHAATQVSAAEPVEQQVEAAIKVIANAKFA